ncbi:MAG: FecR domain-containing protein [Phycisphaerae bacterium]|nr:FecR domain-containing protein [Phycisphaerae bacterium]
MDNKDIHKYNELFIKAQENTIDPDEFEQLNQAIISDPQVAQHYVDFMILDDGLSDLDSVAKDIVCEDSAEEYTSKALLAAIIETEHQKDRAVQIIEQDQQKKASGKKISTPLRYQVSVIGILRIAGAIMAIIGVALLLTLIEKRPLLPNSSRGNANSVIAILEDHANAVWETPVAIAEKLYAGNTLKLKKGFAKIRFKDGAVVLLQAPCEIGLEDAGRMYLASGILTATVPREAIGFTVRTDRASIVDYGTEFAVSVSDSGQTEAHVFRGKVDFRAGMGTAFLSSGKAAKDSNGKVVSCKYQASGFVRDLPQGIVNSVPGEKLDLADVLGGGSGYGTGNLYEGIDMRTGDRIYQSDEQAIQGTGRYVLVRDSKFIDGVFVPDGSHGAVQVSSARHYCSAIPATNNFFYTPICNNPKINMSDYDDPQPLAINGKKYGDENTPLICMHSNAGITFDLDAIRQANPGSKIRSFKAVGGIIDATTIYDEQSVSVKYFIIVDGQVKFEKVASWTGTRLFDIAVELSDNERFLTLVCTDDGLNYADWSIFAKPILQLEPIEGFQ